MDDAQGELDGPRALLSWALAALPRLLPAVADGLSQPGWLGPVETQIFLQVRVGAQRHGKLHSLQCRIVDRDDSWLAAAIGLGDGRGFTEPATLQLHFCCKVVRLNNLVRDDTWFTVARACVCA